MGAAPKFLKCETSLISTNRQEIWTSPPSTASSLLWMHYRRNPWNESIPQGRMVSLNFSKWCDVWISQPSTARSPCYKTFLCLSGERVINSILFSDQKGTSYHPQQESLVTSYKTFIGKIKLHQPKRIFRNTHKHKKTNKQLSLVTKTPIFRKGKGSPQRLNQNPPKPVRGAGRRRPAAEAPPRAASPASLKCPKISRWSPRLPC